MDNNSKNDDFIQYCSRRKSNKNKSRNEIFVKSFVKRNENSNGNSKRNRNSFAINSVSFTNKNNTRFLSLGSPINNIKFELKSSSQDKNSSRRDKKSSVHLREMDKKSEKRDRKNMERSENLHLPLGSKELEMDSSANRDPQNYGIIPLEEGNEASYPISSTSGCNGIFSRRLDFSSFNLLPKTRLNSYQVKMEDEGNHGNDETRLFILSSLAQHQKNRVSCVLCEEPMLVFDRYPLVDGSFFLSPKQHAPGCIEVKYEERIHYLTAVCMVCLDGNTSNHAIYCRFCGERWDGSSLVLGTMYSYDIFAAMPCCVERLQCNACLKLLLHPQQMLNFYSNYSQMVSCPYCTIQDYHFVKPLGYCYTKQSVKINLQ